jgi:type IV pilus assembly protein PilY1
MNPELLQSRGLRVFVRAILLGLLMLCATAGGSALAQTTSSTTNVLEEDFTGAQPLLSDWYSIDGACLTAGDQTNSGPNLTSSNSALKNSPQGGIPACKGDSYYSGQTQTGLTNNADPVGQGALRLTNGCAGSTCYYHQDGAVFLQNSYPTNQGIRVTFTTYTYGGDNSGGHGADGIAFYILDGNFTPNVGAWGGSLGYSCSNTNPPYNGMSGGYLGLGMDEYGNYLNQGDNTATGIDGTRHPGEIGVRGFGNINLQALQAIDPEATVSDVKNACATGYYEGHKLNDYAYVQGYSKTGLTIANESATKRSQATPITYTLQITPGGLLSLWYKDNATNTNGGYGTQAINNLPITDASNFGPLPSSFKFGFGGSTGGSDNVHEITCFQVVPETQAAVSPVAPLAISGSTYIYTLSSTPNPVAGHVQAFKTVSAPTSSSSSPLGTGSGSALWDAGDSTHMSASARGGALYSTSTTNVPVLLSALDSAAFGTATPTCLPSGSGTSGIVSYTVNPSYNSGSCLGTRLSGWMLGPISTADDAHYLSSPGNANLLSLSGYVSFAQANVNREKVLLFTSNDGFLYAVDASTGNLVWGWMPRPFVSYLASYPGLIGTGCGNTNTNGGCFDGHFTTTDAVNASGKWNTYVVGTAAGGALHYSLGLTSNSANAPMPSSQPWSVSVAGGSSPQQQAPVIATIGGSQYALFVVNKTSTSSSGSTTTSTLYEVNVATGAGSTSGSALSFTANSSMTYVPSTGTLWIGDTKGKVWSLNISGSASSDASGAANEATLSPAAPVNYVGYTEYNGLPYMWAASQNEVETFLLSGGAAQALWASAGGSSPQGYVSSSSGLTASSSVPALQASGQVAALPSLINGVLVVPVYVPPTGSCGETGTAYYDLIDLLSGGLPKVSVTYRNIPVTNGVVSLGLGVPFTPSFSVTSEFTLIYPGTSQPVASGSSINPIVFAGSVMNKPIAWRQY